MAGKGTISVNQAPQYGDKTALESAAKAVTTTPMTGNITPARGAGRPSGGATPAPTQAPPTQTPGVLPEHQRMGDAVARAYRTKVYWDAVLQESPSEWSRMYAADANRNYQRIAKQYRANTPYFE